MGALFAILLFAVTACGDSMTPMGSTEPIRRSLHEGDKAPLFAIDALNGPNKVALTRGTVTLVVFWATWCEPCKRSFPKYQQLYVDLEARGVEIAAISVDEEPSGIAAFARHLGATFPVGWDEGWKIADRYQRPSVPTAYIIGRDGKVKHIHAGYRDGEENEIEKEIESLL